VACYLEGIACEKIFSKYIRTNETEISKQFKILRTDNGEFNDVFRAHNLVLLGL
jgi:hypothetical protein